VPDVKIQSASSVSVTSAPGAGSVAASSSAPSGAPSRGAAAASISVGDAPSSRLSSTMPANCGAKTIPAGSMNDIAYSNSRPTQNVLIAPR
jgi:hypothetical protein